MTSKSEFAIQGEMLGWSSYWRLSPNVHKKYRNDRTYHIGDRTPNSTLEGTEAIALHVIPLPSQYQAMPKATAKRYST
jgi:hypothetical protein